MRLRPLIPAIVFGLVASLAGAQEGYKGFVRGDALITVRELKQLIDRRDPQLVIVAVVKKDAFLRGHIPGAHQTWRPDYEMPVNDPFPFTGMLLDRGRFEAFARGLGVSDASKVVLYDHKYDATRLWWAFYLYGKRDCRVLDGGYPAWKRAGVPAADGDSREKPDPGSFSAARADCGWIATMQDAWRARSDADVQLWDNREEDEWTGAKLKDGAFRRGRIPWARPLDWKEFKLKVSDGEKYATAFRTAEEMQAVVREHRIERGKRHVFYCHSGVRTTQIIFSLYLLGWDVNGLVNYDGSWVEWSYYGRTPVAVSATAPAPP